MDKTEGRTLRDTFLRSARLYPDRPALMIKGAALTYAELERRARALAGRIVRSLGRAPARVGVFAYRSEPAYVGTLAALFSGAAFVPLNRTFPRERTQQMIDSADLDALIVDEESAAQLADLPAGKVAVIRPSDGEVLKELPAVIPDEVAYLLFTSGSTGRPKGVPVTHANVLHFLDVMGARYCFTPDDRCTQTFDQTFDLSVFDLFMAWSSGACVCVMQPLDLLAPASFVNKHGITVWFSVPSVAALMRKKGTLKPGLMPSLRWSLFCGEGLPSETVRAWQEAAPNSTVENLYGPTELTIACMAHRFTEESPDENGTVPIGRPLPGIGVMVRDGELCVCGPQTCPGYWRDEEKTVERFFTEDGIRFYRTGDRVKRLDTGDYLHLGRVDFQIKVLGHRVELGEVEAALRSGGAVDAVAFGWPVEDGSAQGVVAFVTGDVEAEALLESARARLPAYMAPGEIRTLETMPLNANGKIDRKALQDVLKRGD